MPAEHFVHSCLYLAQICDIQYIIYSFIRSFVHSTIIIMNVCRIVAINSKFVNALQMMCDSIEIRMHLLVCKQILWWNLPPSEFQWNFTRILMLTNLRLIRGTFTHFSPNSNTSYLKYYIGISCPFPLLVSYSSELLSIMHGLFIIWTNEIFWESKKKIGIANEITIIAMGME